MTFLHSVCGLYTIRQNRTNSLSLSAQLHCFTWHCGDVTESTWPYCLHLKKKIVYLIFFFLNTCSYAREHTIPQKFKGQLHQIKEAFLQVYAVPLQGGLARLPFTLRRKTLRLSTMGCDVRFLLEPINTNALCILTVTPCSSVTKVLIKKRFVEFSFEFPCVCSIDLYRKKLHVGNIRMFFTWFSSNFQIDPEKYTVLLFCTSLKCS